MMSKWPAVAALILALTGSAYAAQEPLVFDSPEMEARYNQLTMELRCLVCQNQNLADSDAELAHDIAPFAKLMTTGRPLPPGGWPGPTRPLPVRPRW